MKMKSVLGLLTVVVTVFAFALTAYAGAGTCYNCEKCAPGKIPCPGSETQTGPQGTTTTTTDAASPFDYDGTPVGGAFGPWGYCAGYNILEQPDRNCKMIFDICKCPTACEFNAGDRIGIKMTILTGGVYWADPSHRTIYFDMYANENAPCPTTNLGVPTVTTMEESNVYDNGAGWGEEDDIITNREVRNFGPIEYYRDTAATVLGTPLAGDYTGTIPVANQVVSLQSFAETDYMITKDDTNDYDCKLWIDIPPMRLDGTAQAGAPINVEVQILYDRENVGICAECHPPITCECTRQVGIICCDSQEVVTGAGCMFFPYVLQGLIDSSGWSTGVAVSCREDAMPADAWVKLTLKDQGGNTSSYTRTNMGSGLVWAFVLDDIMAEFDTALIAGATSLQVESNYSMDGYQFLNVAGTFGAGSNARGCDGKCCP